MSATTDEILAGTSFGAWFARGQLDQVIAGHTRKPATRPSERAAVVAAYAWSGRLDEALALHARFGVGKGRAAPAPEYREPATCMLVIGLCHAGELAQARALLATVRAEPLAVASPLHYYRLHARAFVAYFRGRMARTIRLGRRALRVAAAHDHAFGQLLTNDLLGHACVHLGLVRRGLRLLRSAGQLAAELGLEDNRLNILAEERIIALTTAPHDDEAVAALIRLLRQPGLSFFTQRHGHVALAIASALRGDLAAAVAARRTAAGFAVGADTRGRIRVLAADGCIAAVRGQRADAERAFDAALRRARTGKHLELLGEVAFWRRLVLGQALAASAATARRDLVRLRWALGEPIAADALDDDLLLAAHGGQAERRLPGLAAAALPAGNVIALGASAMVLRSEHAVVTCAPPPTASARLLDELGRGPRSRAELVRAMYGLRAYHPALHNGALYTAVSRIRRALGEHGGWVESTSDGYRLAAGGGRGRAGRAAGAGRAGGAGPGGGPPRKQKTGAISTR